MSTTTTTTRREKGVSLARFPALVIGTVLLVAGLFFLYKLHTFPKLSQFPNGHAPVTGKAFFNIFGLNGWSGELTAVAGGVLLFGAAQHLLAKTASLIVGVALGVVAIIALVNHHSALGLFAANIWTIIGWGGTAAFLLINSLLPRTSGSETEVATSEPVREPVRREPVQAEPVQTQPVRTQPVPTQPVQTQPVQSVPVRTEPIAEQREPIDTTADTTTGATLHGDGAPEGDTLIPERPAVRVRPTTDSVPDEDVPPAS